MSSTTTLVVQLFLHRDRKAEFEQFESRAVEIMKRYGGSIERRVCCASEDDSSQPDEVHIVTFPNRESFDRYRQDTAIRDLAEIRARSIRRTIVWYGSDLPPFGTSS